MDKFDWEKQRKSDIVKVRGCAPIWLGIRKGDEYVSEAQRSHPSSPANDLETGDDQEAQNIEMPQKELASILSSESLQLYARLMFAHPDTLVGKIIEVHDGQLEIEIISHHRSFALQLQHALQALDKTKRQTGV
jgi:hypothetical protein